MKINPRFKEIIDLLESDLEQALVKARALWPTATIGPPIFGDESILAGLHKARAVATDYPETLREKSRQWLKEHGWGVYTS